MNSTNEKRLAVRATELGNSADGKLAGIVAGDRAVQILYKVGMLKKLKLYQQQGKRLVSLYREAKSNLNAVLCGRWADICTCPMAPFDSVS